MSGNVREWCWDAYSSSYRVRRGGGWGNVASDCTVSRHTGTSPDSRRVSNVASVGFRVARSGN